MGARSKRSVAARELARQRKLQMQNNISFEAVGKVEVRFAPPIVNNIYAGLGKPEVTDVATMTDHVPKWPENAPLSMSDVVRTIGGVWKDTPEARLAMATKLARLLVGPEAAITCMPRSAPKRSKRSEKRKAVPKVKKEAESSTLESNDA